MKTAQGNIKKRRISPDDGAHYFFAYYDLQAYDESGTRHLCHRVQFMDRLPVSDDIAELGYIELGSGEFVKFAETTAWNFQQGAMLQWNPANGDEVIYNIAKGSEYHTVIHNIKTGVKRCTERAIANVSPDGKWGLSINFNRVYDFRPGYGYPGQDKYKDIPQPEEDGIFLVNMITGSSRLIVDYKRILKEFPSNDFPDAKYVVNHITFNTTSERFLFLNRNFPAPDQKGWKTSLFTSDLDGNLTLLLSDTIVSHYHWKNASQILGYYRIDDANGIYLLDDITADSLKYDAPCFNSDIHCLYSPDRRYIMGDGYPDSKKHRNLYIYDTETGECDTLQSVFSVKPSIGDIRCDLHALWNRDGTKVSYDSTETGKREIYELDVSYLY